MIGGILTSFLLELVVYPPVYQIWKWNFGLKRRLSPSPDQPKAQASGMILDNEETPIGVQ
jgi:hypothetical protein